MASEVGIANLALAQIGQTQFINDPAEDSEPANACNVLYAQNRDETLEAFRWPFAQQRSKPAPLVATTLHLGAVPTGWEYAFAMPADCIGQSLQIFSGTTNPRSDQEVPFQVEWDATLQALIVLCHLAAPEFVYTARVTDPNLFPASFIRALAWNLSEDLCYSLRKDPKLGLMCRQSYEASLAGARASSLQGGQHVLEPVPAHIAAR